MIAIESAWFNSSKNWSKFIFPVEEAAMSSLCNHIYFNKSYKSSVSWLYNDILPGLHHDIQGDWDEMVLGHESELPTR